MADRNWNSGSACPTMSDELPLFPVRMRSEVQSVAKKSNLIPNDEPFIWLVYAPPNSGESTFVANVILDERWGFSGRHKNLISKEAAKVGDDNPYDPEVLDDPDTDCWPVAELKDAEQVSKDQIMTYKPEDGEQRQLAIIDDYGSVINHADITGKKGWLKIAASHLRKKSWYRDLLFPD